MGRYTHLTTLDPCPSCGARQAAAAVNLCRYIAPEAWAGDMFVLCAVCGVEVEDAPYEMGRPLVELAPA